MIPSITPPTDNLYKFRAIAGLFLALASGIAFFNQLNEARQLASRMSSASAVFGVQHRYFMDEIRAARIAGTLSADTALTRRRQAIEEQQKQIDGQIEDWVYFNDRILPAVLAFLLIGVGAGIVVAWRGFSSWEKHVQGPENDLLRYKLAIARREAEGTAPVPPSPVPTAPTDGPPA